MFRIIAAPLAQMELGSQFNLRIKFLWNDSLLSKTSSGRRRFIWYYETSSPRWKQLKIDIR